MKLQHETPPGGRPRFGPAVLVGLLQLALLLLLVPPTAHAAEAQAPEAAARASTFVDDYVERHGLHAATFVVVRDGEIVVEGASGPLPVDAPLPIASVSKSLTAFAVLQLVDAGLVGLDAPITEVLPSFSVRGADPREITVRRLLTHTSGLPNPLLVESTEGQLALDVANIAEQQVASAPGTAYLYSNLNYWTLARLVEVVSGTDFGSYLTSKIFEPLGMHDTSSVTLTAPPAFAHGRVTAYGTALELPSPRTSVGGSGGVVSTAHDLGLWLAMQQRGGLAADGTRLLSAELVEESHAVAPNTQNAGFGWLHTTTADPPRIGHDGASPRYSARQDLVPSTGTATAVLLDSFTPTVEHAFAISTGLIQVSEGRDPEIGAPIATLIDLLLGAITVLLSAAGVRGVARSRRWATRRSAWPWWRFAARQLPQLIAPIAAGLVFLGLTVGRGNPATPLDVFGLWPAAAVALLAAAVVGGVLVSMRTTTWLGLRRTARRAARHPG